MDYLDLPMKWALQVVPQCGRHNALGESEAVDWPGVMINPSHL